MASILKSCSEWHRRSISKSAPASRGAMGRFALVLGEEPPLRLEAGGQAGLLRRCYT